jgi:hypothetical protein
MIDFHTYCRQKKIDPDRFSAIEKTQFEYLESIFNQVSPESFTDQKLFLINDLRRKFLLAEEPVFEQKAASDSVAQAIAKPTISKPNFAKPSIPKKEEIVEPKQEDETKEQEQKPIVKPTVLKPNFARPNIPKKENTEISKPIGNELIIVGETEENKQETPQKALVKPILKPKIPLIKKVEENEVISDNKPKTAALKPKIPPRKE